LEKERRCRIKRGGRGGDTKGKRRERVKKEYRAQL
jgi:hypothetical protein